MSFLKKSKLLKAMVFTGTSLLSIASLSVGIGTNQSISKVSSSTQAASIASAANKTTATSGMGTSDTSNDFVTNSISSVENSKLTVYPFDMSLGTNSNSSTYTTDTFTTPSIIQNTAYDETSNTGYASFVKYNSKDAIAKFLSKDTTNSSSATVYAGTTQWVVTSDDLIKLATKQVTGTEATDTTNYTLTFKAMLFSAGGNSSAPSLFVIASIINNSDKNINGSYLFQINWDKTTNSSVTGEKGAGSYRLAAVLSKDESFIDYNFLVMDGVSTNTMEVLQLGDLTYKTTETTDDSSTTTSTYGGNYVTVSNSIFNKNDTTATSHSLTFDSTTLSSYVTSNVTYKPVFVSNINSRFFMVYKSESTTIDSKSILLIRTDLLTNNLEKDITISSADNFKNLDFSSLGLEINSKNFNLLFYYNSSLSSSTAMINMVISIPGQSKYAYASFDAISFAVGTSPVAYDGYSTNGFISQIVPYYSLNENTIYGYYALTSTNQVIKLDTSFKYVSEVYDFGSSIYNVGNIYKILTVSASSSATWYAQMTNGLFAKMNNSNLVGQWDSLYKKDSYEKAGDFLIKSQDEVDSSVFFRKVVNDSGDDFDTSFLSYISGSSLWKEFLTTVTTDTQVSLEPSIIVSIYNYDAENSTTGKEYYFGTSSSNKLDPKKNNSITLVFTQNLRKINAGGSVDSNTTTKEIIGSYTYTFYYGTAKINGQTTGTYNYSNYQNYVAETGLSIPQYVLDMYPSKIATLINSGTSGDSDSYNFISSFLSMNNIVNPTITVSGNDTTGVLTINVSVPYIWESDSSSSATANGIWTFTFGSSSSPFFNYNPFGFSDSDNNVSNASVTPIDATYASNSSNRSTIQALKDKYSTVLASSLSKIDFYNDFLVLGNAFSNSSNISSGLIELPTEDLDSYITIVPNDIEGNAYVSITFPKIGPETNYTVSFTTPSIFMKDSSASQSVYFSWKSSSQVTTISNQSISNLQASSVASTFNASSSSSSINDKITLLENFAVLSNYYTNLIAQNKLVISATYDDKVGFLTINVDAASGVSIPGLDETNLSMTYTGFKTSTSGSSNISTSDQTSSFSWGTYSADSSVSPSSITISNLLSSSLLSGNSNLSSWVSSGLATITLTPSNSTGTLAVTVTLKNYSSNSTSGSGTISPIKTFTRTIGGFATTNENTNMIVWKTNTNTSFQSNGSAKLPSALVTTATSGDYSENSSNYLYNRLTYFANLSSDLDATLKSNPDQIKSVTLQPNDSDGTLIVTAIIQQNGISVVYSTTITGLGTTSSLQPTITFNADDATNNNAALNSLREMTPSSITTTNSDLLSLFTISDSSDNYVTSIDLSYDDYGGSLTITVSVIDPSTSTTITTSSKTYTGFATTVDTSASTNWGIVAASIIIPLVVLLIPVFLYGYIQQRKDMKTISSRLSNRLHEEEEREKRLRRKQELIHKIK